jgi:hypothetical protein
VPDLRVDLIDIGLLQCRDDTLEGEVIECDVACDIPLQDESKVGGRLLRLLPGGTALSLGVSGRNRCLRKRIVGGLESLPEAGAEGAIIDCAANLEQ